VFDPDEEPARGNGFVFRAPLPVELLKTVRRALRAFRDRRRWRSLVGNGMAADYSWSRSAREYVEVYLAAIDDARRRAADSEPAAGINREVQQ
jgi:starch synthase